MALIPIPYIPLNNKRIVEELCLLNFKEIRISLVKFTIILTRKCSYNCEVITILYEDETRDTFPLFGPYIYRKGIFLKKRRCGFKEFLTIRLQKIFSFL
jgi:hypothetical protein